MTIISDWLSRRKMCKMLHASPLLFGPLTGTFMDVFLRPPRCMKLRKSTFLRCLTERRPTTERTEGTLSPKLLQRWAL